MGIPRRGDGAGLGAGMGVSRRGVIQQVAEGEQAGAHSLQDRDAVAAE
jgi:hypothetical protein